MLAKGHSPLNATRNRGQRNVWNWHLAGCPAWHVRYVALSGHFDGRKAAGATPGYPSTPSEENASDDYLTRGLPKEFVLIETTKLAAIKEAYEAKGGAVGRHALLLGSAEPLAVDRPVRAGRDAAAPRRRRDCRCRDRRRNPRATLLVIRRAMDERSR